MSLHSGSFHFVHAAQIQRIDVEPGEQLSQANACARDHAIEIFRTQAKLLADAYLVLVAQIEAIEHVAIPRRQRGEQIENRFTSQRVLLVIVWRVDLTMQTLEQ